MIAGKPELGRYEITRLLLVNEHAGARADLRRLFAAFLGMELYEAASDVEALALVHDKLPTLIVLDLDAPRLGGLHLLRSIRTDNPRVRVVVLSECSEAIYVKGALRAGVEGYVRKCASCEELLQTVRHVAEGKRYIDAELAQVLALQVLDARR